jgi:hypothetical protein
VQECPRAVGICPAKPWQAGGLQLLMPVCP